MGCYLADLGVMILHTKRKVVLAHLAFIGTINIAVALPRVLVLINRVADERYEGKPLC